MNKLKRFILIALLNVVLLVAVLWVLNTYTNFGFAQFFREDKCLDNGGRIDRENHRCDGGLYDGMQLKY
jgi:hypothetical protein